MGDELAAIRPAVAELAALPGVDIVVVTGGIREEVDAVLCHLEPPGGTE